VSTGNLGRKYNLSGFEGQVDLQVIDLENSKLGNVITFPPDGAFIVDSSLSREGNQRLNFKFTAAKLKLPARTISLPPYGQGWWEFPSLIQIDKTCVLVLKQALFLMILSLH
jgi:hypothetical protein